MKPANRLAAGLSGKTALPALVLGVIAGANQVVSKVALGTVVFSGALAPYAAEGTRLVLLGNAIVCLVIALASGFRGAVGTSPPALLIVVAGIGTALTLQGDALFATMVAIIAIGSLATGLCAVLLGSLGLANLTRFVPYPVACGFVAGTGALVCKIAFSLLAVTPVPKDLAALLDPLAISNWGLGIAYGLGLFLATKRSKGFLILPVSFATLIALFYLTLGLFDISVGEAETAGLLFTGMSESAEGGLWPLFRLESLGHVNWSAVTTQIPSLLALILLSFLCLVIYLGSFELASDLDLDWNREFRAMGMASMAAGLGSGPPGTLVVSPSLRNLMFGADTRLVGVVVALFVAAVSFLGNVVLRLVPVPLIGGVLLFTGAVLLESWLVKVRHKLPRLEFAIVVLIFLAITFFGFLTGVGVGMLVMVVFLVVRLAAVDPVESRFTALEHRSSRIRPVPDRAILRMRGASLRAYKLRGYLFFGSAFPLTDRLKRSLGSEDKPTCILLDFDAVTGCDVSAVNAFGRFIRAAHRRGTQVALSGTSDEFNYELSRNLPSPVNDRLLLAANADRALELCEELILDSAKPASGADAESGDGSLLALVADDLTDHLDRQVLFENLIDELGAWLEPLEYAAGETIVAIEEAPRRILLLTSGRASVFDSSGTRLFERGPGDAIEAAAGLGGQSARVEVRAGEPCRALVLTPEVAALLEQDEPELMLRLYRYLVRLAPS